MRPSAARLKAAGTNLLRRQPSSSSRLSADLAGRTVALSPAVPFGFDEPLPPHHKLIGRWIAAHQPSDRVMTRMEARQHIEAAFDAAVMDALGRIDIADFRVVVLTGDVEKPPALAIICDSIGQVELGWIEQTNVLANTLKGRVAPVGWRARAYKALADTLAAALPLFTYDEMFEELAGMYWDGETEDGPAVQSAEMLGYDPNDIILPSQVHAKKPDFMLAENAAPLKGLPPALAAILRRLDKAHTALIAIKEGNAWWFEHDQLLEYAPEYEDAAYLPPMTLVPVDHFNAEVDEVGRMGMESIFQSAAGLCPITDVAAINRWFETLRLGADLLTAAQDLIAFDPFADRGRA